MAKDSVWGQFPHCDASVLHAPGECEYCDVHPEWQILRDTWGIAFTGHRPAEGQVPCPSDARRGTGGAHTWAGNRPLNPNEQAPAHAAETDRIGRKIAAAMLGIHHRVRGH